MDQTEHARRASSFGSQAAAYALAQDVDVVAVEPDPAMLAELTSRFPGAAAKAGNAEQIPLPDSSVNAAFAGQALHWFDLDRALPEIRRVLRPDGFLVAMWNDYDDRVPWVREFCRVSGAAARNKQDDDILEPLGPTEVTFAIRATPS